MNRKAFTLAEAMIAILLSGIIILIFLTILTLARSSWYTADVQSDLYLNARRAMDELSKELIEAPSGDDFSEIFTFVDPINGQTQQGIWFASARGDIAVAGEDGIHAGNNYVHTSAGDNTYERRSVVIYCPFQTAEGLTQARRYVDFGSSVDYYDGNDIFPLTFDPNLVTATTFTLIEANGTTSVTIDRTGGTVVGNYIATEDTNNNNSLDGNEDDGETNLPVDNADGILNYGINFVKNGDVIRTTLFLRREITRLRQSGRFLSITLSHDITLRQP